MHAVLPLLTNFTLKENHPAIILTMEIISRRAFSNHYFSLFLTFLRLIKMLPTARYPTAIKLLNEVISCFYLVIGCLYFTFFCCI